MTGSPIYDEMRPRYLLVDLPPPDPPATPGRHARTDREDTTMPLSGATVRAALTAVNAVGRQIRGFDELAAGADDALRQAPPGLTAAGAASFLATLAQESDYFRTTREYAKNPSYAPWVGRTFCQLTHQEAYQRFGAWCRARGLAAADDVFVRNPAALEDYRYAWLGGVFYFEWRNLWPIANTGDHLQVSRIVNGGPGWAKRIGPNWLPNHWDARRRMFEAFTRAGADLLPGSGAPATPAPAGRPSLREGDTGAAVHAVAVFLNRTLGGFATYRPIDLDAVPDRQRYGPQTVAAVRDFQARAGVTGPDADGTLVGPRTWAALERFGYR